MDGYSRAVIKLLLERDRAYLSELVGADVPESATVDMVCMMITDSKGREKIGHVSSIYRCKCGSNNVVLREVQTRSADEGSTVLHVCKNCGHAW